MQQETKGMLYLNVQMGGSSFICLADYMKRNTIIMIISIDIFHGEKKNVDGLT